jgi:23S rRNA (guanosine2251-2'-O)-methyltransferase
VPYHPVVTGSILVACPDPTCGLDFPVPAGLAWRRVACPECGAEGPAIEASVRRRLRSVAATSPLPTVSAGAMVAVLEDLRSVHNVGSILRTCDAFAVELVVMVGITATPEHPRMARTALGAERTVPWAWRADGVEAVRELVDRGVEVVALERTPRATPLAEVRVVRPLALVVGNEVGGVSGPVLARAAMHAAIPMAGTKTSLNAAVAFAVAAWQLGAES